MLLIGLTGSIATGKSTVSSLLSAPPYSLPVIDADLLARQVVEPGTPGYRAIVSHFGSDILVPAAHPSMPETGPAGLGRPLDRPKLGRRVFGDDPKVKEDRRVLNGIVHPAVRRAMFWGVVRAYLRGSWGVVLDVPLLYESELDRFCGTVMVVGVRDPKVQMERLMARDAHLSEEDAGNRVRSQGDVREKARRAEEGGGVVVWNDGDKAELERELEKVMGVLKERSPGWWEGVLWVCPPLAGVVAALGYIRNLRERKRWLEDEGKRRAKL